MSSCHGTETSDSNNQCHQTVINRYVPATRQKVTRQWKNWRMLIGAASGLAVAIYLCKSLSLQYSRDVLKFTERLMQSVPGDRWTYVDQPWRDVPRQTAYNTVKQLAVFKYIYIYRSNMLKMCRPYS